MGKAISTILVLTGILLLPRGVTALSVSDIEMSSSLNQRLQAQIHLVAVTQEELGSLEINIDMIEGIANSQRVQLVHEVRQDENGHYIYITSKDVIREPVLNFTVEFIWSKGRLIKEYSLLLDPR